MTRARRIRTVVAALAVSLLTAVPVISAERAPAPLLGDPVVVERAPRSSPAAPSARPYEDGARLETGTPSPGSPRQTGQPAGSTGPTDDDALDVSEPTPTPTRATSQGSSSSDAEPVLPVSPLPASSRNTGTPTPTAGPTSDSGDDDASDGDDGGGDDG
jgi:hypothetical protein